jgi:hypothetical protein
VLGDCDEQEVEEEALVLVRLAAGEQEVEVLGEAQPAHEIAREISSPHFDPVGEGLADVADGGTGLTDLHTSSSKAEIFSDETRTRQHGFEPSDAVLTILSPLGQ